MLLTMERISLIWSFGKGLSPQESMVNDALKYAEEKKCIGYSRGRKTTVRITT